MEKSQRIIHYINNDIKVGDTVRVRDFSYMSNVSDNKESYDCDREAKVIQVGIQDRIFTTFVLRLQDVVIESNGKQYRTQSGLLDKIDLEDGWDLYHSSGSADGDWQIQKNDEVGAFETDADAIKYVYEQALKGGKRHREALATIAEKNPQELRHIFN